MKIRDLKEKLAQIENDDIEIFVSPLIEMTRLSGGDEENTTSLIPSPFSRFELKVMSISDGIGDTTLSDRFLLLSFDDSTNYGANKIPVIEDAGDHIN